MDNLHKQLIDELMANPVTPTDHAVVNEIKALRAQLQPGGVKADAPYKVESKSTRKGKEAGEE